MTEQNSKPDEKKNYRTLAQNFQKYIELDIDQREYSTKVSPPPAQGQLEIIDEIISEQMTEIEEKYHNTLWTLNVIYYIAAITLLEKEGKLRGTNRRKEEYVKPGWQIRLESRIEAIRKKLSYVHVLIECNKKQKYTNTK